MADSLDLISLTEAKAALNVTVSTYDTEIAAYVTAVSRQIDKMCGPVVTRTLTSESRDGGDTKVYLANRPLSTVTTVIEYDGNTATTLTAETAGALTSNQYLVDAAKGILYRRDTGWDCYFPPGRKNIIVTYAAGRYTSTGVVDERFKTAARLCLTNMWRREQGGGTDTFGALPGTVIPGFGMPNAVLDLLADDIQHPEVG